MLKKFYRFILFINIVIISIFLIFYFRTNISEFLSSQTGLDINIAAPNMDWVAFWKKDDAKEDEKEENTKADSNNKNNSSNNDDGKGEQKEQKESAFDKRFAALSGNTVVGINYSESTHDPANIAACADRIVRAKIKSIRVVPYENIVHTEITAKIQHTYKGQEADEMQIYSFGGVISGNDIKNGQIKTAASKSNESSEQVNVLMDFCEPVEEGKSYIIFANNDKGIMSPVCGNMSFFKLDGNKVKRLSSEDDEFSMKQREFEKKYLDQYK